MPRPLLLLAVAALQAGAPQAQLQSQARAALLARRAQLGLGAQDGFEALSCFSDREGLNIVRLDQTYAGRRVWGAQALARLAPDGSLRDVVQRLQPGIALEGGPRLDPQQALAAALRALAPRGPMPDAPQVEPVVFPARFLGGLAVSLDAQGRPVLDRRRTVHAKLAAPFAWAYEVRTRLHNAQDGAHEWRFVVDAGSGNILRADDLAQHQAAVTPATGAGQGYYRGSVSLDTSHMADGSYALYDTTRGALPNPLLQSYTPDGSGWSATGMQAWWEEHDATGAPTWNSYLFQSNPTNAWGDGQPWAQAWGQESGARGQTAGVDALSAMASTWDFYAQVFGRNGLDGQGTSVFAQVLSDSYAAPDDAWWSIGSCGVYLGAGSYPANPAGCLSMTDLDIVAHELTHGVTSPTYSQAWAGGSGTEEAGLNEATSDFFAQMVKSYTARPAGSPAGTIPDSGADWEQGAGVHRGTPLRWLDQPSRDQRSVDGWFDGIAYMDGHYSSGPLNRALYFLCEGASPTPGDPHASVFLPGGMTGIGKDAAARIWFKAVTEKLIPDGTGSITYAEARDAAIAAAQELHGAGSPEEAAVMQAFAAVNVGLAPGQAPRVEVRFAAWRNNDYIETSHFTDYSNRQIFPMGETVRPRISVANAADASVAWSLGGPSMYNGAESNVQEGGVLNADGSWTTPYEMAWHSITATSRQDPSQLAEGRVFLINMDTDMDLEQDATDMAGIAYSWYLSNALNPAHSVLNAPWVDDTDVSFFVDAMRSTWPAQ